MGAGQWVSLMSDHRKRPRDPSQLGKFIVQVHRASSSCKLIVELATGSIEATSSAEPVMGWHDREGEHAKTGTLYEVAKDTIGDGYHVRRLPCAPHSQARDCRDVLWLCGHRFADTVAAQARVEADKASHRPSLKHETSETQDVRNTRRQRSVRASYRAVPCSVGPWLRPTSMGFSLIVAAFVQVLASSQSNRLSFSVVACAAQRRASAAYRRNSLASDMAAPSYLPPPL
jgi:hypothetical protein